MSKLGVRRMLRILKTVSGREIHHNYKYHNFGGGVEVLRSGSVTLMFSCGVLYYYYLDFEKDVTIREILDYACY